MTTMPTEHQLELHLLYLGHFGDRQAWTPDDHTNGLQAVYEAGQAAPWRSIVLEPDQWLVLQPTGPITRDEANSIRAAIPEQLRSRTLVISSDLNARSAALTEMLFEKAAETIFRLHGAIATAVGIIDESDTGDESAVQRARATLWEAYIPELDPEHEPDDEAPEEPAELCLICKATGPVNFACPHPDAHTPLATSKHDENGEPWEDEGP